MKGEPAEKESVKPAPKIVRLEQKTSSNLPPKDHELLRLSRYLEQADAVHREAWWVVAADRKPPGKTLFGKVQRALAQELKLKLSNKSLFKCDRYVVKREILSPAGLPQKGSVFESCRSRSEALHLADYNLKSKQEAEVIFQGQNLGEVLGLGTAILNKYIRCQFRGDDDGKLTDMTCQDLSQDRSSIQSLHFSVYEYHRGGQNLLKLRGQVVESLYPIRKFEADVPLEGKIRVVETQTEAPEGMKAKAPPPLPSKPAPSLLDSEPPPPATILPTGRHLEIDPDSLRRREMEEGVPIDQQLEDMNAASVRSGARDQAPGEAAPTGALPAEAEPGDEGAPVNERPPQGPPAPPVTPSRR